MKLKLPAPFKKFLLGLLGALSFIAITAPVARAQEPIVFIHGYAGGNYNWDTMVNRFIASGYPASKLYRFTYNSYMVSNETAASQLSNFISSVRANNNGVQVSIIAHSNGGLVARWYKVKQGGAGSVRRFITLGTPHKGSTSAYSCNYYNIICAEMTPGSSFLASLGSAGCDRSLWSANDGMVTPASNATCGTGANIQVASVSHMTLLTDQSVYNVVRQQLP
jgi:triacylglycerol lipase